MEILTLTNWTWFWFLVPMPLLAIWAVISYFTDAPKEDDSE
ncbi:hypothetical protein ACFFJI_07980 [Allobacillus sp. GCM10007491]|nr:hypothetical protein [Allobacillus saliphilus]